MLFSEMCESMVNTVTFIGFRGGFRTNHPPLDPPLVVCVVIVVKVYYI